MSEQQDNIEARSVSTNDLWGYGPVRPVRGTGYVGAYGSLTSSWVWQAVDMISSDIAGLPFNVYERDGERRTLADTNPAFRLLRRYTGQRGVARSTDMTSNMWLVRMMSQALLYGNAFSQILINRQNGWPMALRWVDVHRVQVRIEQGIKFYLLQLDPYLHGDGRQIRVPASEMVHLEGLTMDEYGGFSLVRFANETFRRLQGTEQRMADFNDNASIPSGFMEYPGRLSDESIAAHQQEWERANSPGNRYRVPILQNGLKYVPLGVTPKDAMAIEALNLSGYDVARYFNIPPHKLGLQATARYSLEEESRNYVISSLDKWLVRLEAECTQKLMSERFYAEFNRDAKLRSDIRTRYEAYQIALNNRFMNANEVRQRENLNPYEGGDEFFGAVNVQPVSAMGQEAEPETDNSTQVEAARKALVFSVRQSWNMLGSILAKQIKSPHAFAAALNQLDRHRDSLAKRIRPSVEVMCAVVNRGSTEEIIDHETRRIVDGMFHLAIPRLLELAEFGDPNTLQADMTQALETLERQSRIEIIDQLFQESEKWISENDTAASNCEMTTAP